MRRNPCEWVLCKLNLKELKMYREHYQIKMEKRSNAAYEYLLALVAGLVFATPLIIQIFKEWK